MLNIHHSLSIIWWMFLDMTDVLQHLTLTEGLSHAVHQWLADLSVKAWKQSQRVRGWEERSSSIDLWSMTGGANSIWVSDKSKNWTARWSPGWRLTSEPSRGRTQPAQCWVYRHREQCRPYSHTAKNSDQLAELIKALRPTQQEIGHTITIALIPWAHLPMWPSGQSTRAPCAVVCDVLRIRSSNLSPGASAHQRIISINSYAHDDQRDNPRQEKTVWWCPL